MGRPLKVSVPAARAFARRAVLIDEPAPDIATALDYHGYIQLDPLNVCGRMHDLILRNRVHNYQEDALTRALHGLPDVSFAPRRERIGFEHYIPGMGVLAAWPRDALPFIRAYLERIHPVTTRRPFTTEEQTLASHFLAEIADRGPLMSDDFEHEGRADTAWGTSGRLVKVVLEKLFAAGRLFISERRGFRRVYDLPGRVLPEVTASALPSDEEFQRWLALLRVRQRRLVSLRRSDRELIGNLIEEVQIEDGPTLYCLRGDRDRFDQAASTEAVTAILLAPLDPLIYDRKVTRALWDFDFTWEVYTPAAARKRGYYSLPVLHGLEIVGDVEPRADRKRRRLVLHSRRVKQRFKTTEAVRSLARFLGLKYP